MGGWAVAAPAADAAAGSVRNVKVCVVKFGVFFFFQNPTVPFESPVIA
jgi:hypothetical protein